MNTNNTPTTDYNVVQPLLKEFEQMRNTLLSFVKLIKQQDERQKDQERRIAELESMLKGVILPSPEQALLDRFAESRKHNRNLSEAPQRIALAAHLAHVKQVPNMRIAECGLMSASKLHGLGQWASQHLIDFCTINNVLDIYENGMPDADIKNLLPDGGYDKLMTYLERKTNSIDS